MCRTPTRSRSHAPQSNPSRPPRAILPARCEGIARLFHELHAAKRFGHMVGGGVGGLPGDAFAIGPRPLQPVEIDAHLPPRLRTAVVNPGDWDAHRAIPDFLVRIDPRRDLVAGIPLPATLRQRMIAIDIEVHPFALR